MKIERDTCRSLTQAGEFQGFSHLNGVRRRGYCSVVISMVSSGVSLPGENKSHRNKK